MEILTESRHRLCKQRENLIPAFKGRDLVGWIDEGYEIV